MKLSLLGGAGKAYDNLKENLEHLGLELRGSWGLCPWTELNCCWTKSPCSHQYGRYGWCSEACGPNLDTATQVQARANLLLDPRYTQDRKDLPLTSAFWLLSTWILGLHVAHLWSLWFTHELTFSLSSLGLKLALLKQSYLVQMFLKKSCRRSADFSRNDKLRLNYFPCSKA